MVCDLDVAMKTSRVSFAVNNREDKYISYDSRRFHADEKRLASKTCLILRFQIFYNPLDLYIPIVYLRTALI